MNDFLNGMIRRMRYRVTVRLGIAVGIILVLGFAYICYIVCTSVGAFFFGDYSLASKFFLFHKDDRVIVWFCEDIFQKNYSKVTEEEKASIRYIAYDNSTASGGEPVIYYSFTDYATCSSEEEFSETVLKWTSARPCYDVPTDFTMFTNLTRVGIHQSMSENKCRFPEVNSIHCLEWYTQPVLPEGIDAKSITSMYYRTGGNDFEFLKDYPALESFGMNSFDAFSMEMEEPENRVMDVGALGNYKQLKQIDLAGSTSYKGLKKLGKIKELKSLSIEGSQIKNCDFLKDFTQLNELGISASYKDIKKYLAKYKKLEKLKLYTVVSDWELKELKKKFPKLRGLSVLCVDNEPVESVSALQNLEDLKIEINISEQKDLDFSSYAKLKKLKRLDIYFSYFPNKILGANAIFNLPKLISLSIRGTSGIDRTTLVTDDKNLQNNSSLRQLKITGCQSEDASESGGTFKFIRHFTGLKILTLQDNHMTHISFVNNLPELTVLNVQFCPVRSYREAKECPQLKVLYAGKELHLADELPENIFVYKIE